MHVPGKIIAMCSISRARDNTQTGIPSPLLAILQSLLNWCLKICFSSKFYFRMLIWAFFMVFLMEPRMTWWLSETTCLLHWGHSSFQTEFRLVLNASWMGVHSNVTNYVNKDSLQFLLASIAINVSCEKCLTLWSLSIQPHSILRSFITINHRLCCACERHAIWLYAQVKLAPICARGVKWCDTISNASPMDLSFLRTYRHRRR